MGNSLTPMSACIATLAKYLQRQIKGLTVIQEWPYGNQQLEYPSVTISTMKPKRSPLFPEQVHITTPDVNGKVTATLVVAEWDDIFQLDLWTRDKLQRDLYLAKIMTAFNRQQNDMKGVSEGRPDGLSLKLRGYNEHVYARFDLDTTECIDDEASAQRQERREKITVLVNTREIRKQTYYAMKSIQISSEVTSENIDLTDDSSGTETVIVD